MSQEIRVPRLGWSMEQGVFLGWRKADGDRIELGDVLYELEGEKATQEIEAVDAGVLRIAADAPQPGAVVPVGALLGHIIAEGASASAAQPATTAGASSAPAAAPSVRRLGRELGVSLADVPGSGPAGRITADDVRARAAAAMSAPTSAPAEPQSARPRSSPRARRLAAELQIDWRRVTGTGRQGRVRECDIRQAAAASTARPAPPPTDAGYVELSPRRWTIAERMRSSQQQTVPVTLTARADATNLVSLRQQFRTRDAAGPPPSYTDICASLTARVLRRHRALAACWDAEGRRLRLPTDDGMNLGIAVDTPEGLLVPVVANVLGRSLLQLAEQTRGLIERARSGRLTAAEMQGGVFTITNLGGFGVEWFTPIINYPETAILGLGAIRREAVVLDDDRVAPRDVLPLSLTFDHRACDGAPAARFLQELVQALENPSAWLLA